MELSSKRKLVMVLCGGKGERLHPLTRDRAKPSVPFLGGYRIIDFSLSNALNSGLRRIALLTQYKSLSLERHILNGWHIFHPESGSYIISLPAQGRISDHWYEGTADAVFQNLYTIQQENPDFVLILSGDHVYRADYRPVIKYALQKQAEAVVLAKPVPVAEASRFGVVGVDAERRIVQFQEKPRNPFPYDDAGEQSLVSMGVYLFRTPVLIKALIKDARNPKSGHDFGKDIFPQLVRDFRVQAWVFDGYWEDIGTVDAYWKANMDFIGTAPPIDMNDRAWPFRTHRPQYPPSYIEGGEIKQSVICEGCRVARARVERSILAHGVRVESGAEVTESIVFEGSWIRSGARLRRTIVDKHCVIPAGFEVGFEREKDVLDFKVSRGGITTVPKGWRPE